MAVRNTLIEKTFPIQWSVDPSISRINIFYSPNNGAGWQIIRLYHSASSGSYNWRPSFMLSSDSCLIHISNYFNGSEYDKSDNVFTIHGALGKTGADGDQLTTETMPEGFSLGQNFPNPFNPTTLINYGLPKATNVRLTVFNTLGQKVATLVHQHELAGFKQVIWNGTDDNGRAVAGGVYIYRMEAGDFVQTKKLLLLK